MAERVYRQRLPDGTLYQLRDVMQSRAVGSLHKSYQFTKTSLEVASRWDAGIYAICVGEEVLYVGQSRNAYYRVFESVRERLENPQAIAIRFWPCDPTELDEREHEAISYFKPVLNKAKTTEARTIRHTWSKPQRIELQIREQGILCLGTIET
ncbi:GIY-YIG nuclease family protein [Marimonas lutisalis]|uniref:hypothetical protein n=1 Tax=Marimonas lutisalis TaxID=2545756 RepID=UPI0010F4A52F|nr:hypothetical protein [Marimonas lutisalis]